MWEVTLQAHALHFCARQGLLFCAMHKSIKASITMHINIFATSPNFLMQLPYCLDGRARQAFRFASVQAFDPTTTRKIEN